MPAMKWTLCYRVGGRVKKSAQYANRETAEKIAKSNGDGWFVRLFPANPERVIQAGGNRKSAYGRKVGLPQY